MYCKPTALPSAECLSLTDVKLFLRLPNTYTAEDAFITALIQAAREHGETITGRALAKRTWVQVMDSFPDRTFRHAIDGSSLYDLGLYGRPYGGSEHKRNSVELYYPPLISVQNITYVDANGAVQTLLPDTDFIVDRTNDFARLTPIPGTLWPQTMHTLNAVAVNFTAGYDPDPTATDTHNVSTNPPDQQTTSTVVTGVLELIRLGMLNLVAYWFQNRGSLTVPEPINSILRSQAVYRF